MGVIRAAFLTSVVLASACGGKLIESGSDPTTGTTGTTGVAGEPKPVIVGTTTGVPDSPPDNPPPIVSEPPLQPSTPCGVTVCAPGFACCDPSCGLCAESPLRCPAVACPRPVMDAGRGVPVNIDEIAGLKSNFGFQWKDSWFITGCQVKQGHDCVNIPSCPNGGAVNFEDRGLVIKELFPLGGKKGTTYAVSFTFHAMSEGKFYAGGTREAGNAVPANIETALLDTFHVGGNPVISNYNVHRMRVLDSAMFEIGRYYMNSFPQASGAESHRTFRLGYSKTIDVVGGGFVEYLIEDSNCHAIDNCGPGDVSDTVCNAAQMIPNEPNIALPPQYMDPSLQKVVPLALLNTVTGASQPWHAQIGHLTITSVVAK